MLYNMIILSIILPLSRKRKARFYHPGLHTWNVTHTLIVSNQLFSNRGIADFLCQKERKPNRIERRKIL